MNGVLASLVSVTGGCYLYDSWSAVLTGAIGSLLCLLCMKLMDKLKIDDPLYACTVHGVGGAWGSYSSNLFKRFFISANQNIICRSNFDWAVRGRSSFATHNRWKIWTIFGGRI